MFPQGVLRLVDVREVNEDNVQLQSPQPYKKHSAFRGVSWGSYEAPSGLAEVREGRGRGYHGGALTAAAAS